MRYLNRLLFDVISILAVLSLVPLLRWSWARWEMVDPRFLGPRGRGLIGCIALLLATAQLLGAFIDSMVVAAMHDFPASLRAWLVWTRVCFFGAVIAIVLLIAGKSRSQIQLLICTVAMSLACVMIATLA
jgi:hypothetical protein